MCKTSMAIRKELFLSFFLSSFLSFFLSLSLSLSADPFRVLLHPDIVFQTRAPIDEGLARNRRGNPENSNGRFLGEGECVQIPICADKRHHLWAFPTFQENLLHGRCHLLQQYFVTKP